MLAPERAANKAKAINPKPANIVNRECLPFVLFISVVLSWFVWFCRNLFRFERGREEFPVGRRWVSSANPSAPSRAARWRRWQWPPAVAGFVHRAGETRHDLPDHPAHSRIVA